MAKKNKGTWKTIAIIFGVLIVIGIVVAILFLGIPNLQFLVNMPSNVDLSQFASQDNSYDCKFTLSKSTACVGESVSSTIEDGDNADCLIGYKYGSDDWKAYNLVTLDSNGEITVSDSAGTSGDYIFAALCQDPEGKVCRTNDARITIVDCDSDCTDTDGNNRDTPGHVIKDGISYYDECIDSSAAVKEYICLDGDVSSQNLACDYGEVCFSTRSGGYCTPSDSGYEVGDVLGSESNSGTLTQGGEGWKIELSGLTDLGDCSLGVRLNTEWSQSDPLNCANEVVEWTFFDSAGFRYQRTDNNPTGLGVEICPVSWDGQTDWYFEMTRPFFYEECQIDYSWSMEIIICEC